MDFTPTQRILMVTFAGVTIFGLGYQAHQASLRRPLAPDGAVFQPAPLPPTITDEPYLRIHVAGAVKTPGVYSLRGDDRVIDAIEQAGGARADARLNELNLAARLVDGMRLYIPGEHDGPRDQVIVVTEDVYLKPPPEPRSPTAQQKPDQDPEVIDAGHQTIGKKPSASSGRKALPTHAININTASLEELQQLPGVGPSMAGKIVAYRSTQGRFASPRDLIRVNGIGETTFAKMAPWVTVN